MHLVIAVLIGLVLAISAAGIAAWPTLALSPEDEQPSASPIPSPSSPLVDALAFVPEEAISLEFTDWAALKALHGGSDITSTSPLEERQRLVLDMLRSDESGIDFGLERLATWPDLWGWDNTDLAWESTWFSDPGWRSTVLRFREGWDPAPFMARLEGYGYSRSRKPHGIIFGGAPDFLPDPGSQPILDTDEQLAPWPVSVAFALDGRTVVIAEGERAHQSLKRAARSDLGASTAGPFGRVALSLGQPVVAYIVASELACAVYGPEKAGLIDDMSTRPASVGVLQPYEALGIGYERVGPGEPAVGRFAFVYKHSEQAMADLPGRRTLVDEGYAMMSGTPPEEVGLSTGTASADPRTLVLDVAMLDDAPLLLFRLLGPWDMSPAACS